MKKIHLRTDFIVREVAGEKILLPVGNACVDYSKMVVLNESAAFLIDQLRKEEGTSAEELLEALTDTYEVDEDTARGDIDELLALLRSEKLLVE